MLFKIADFVIEVRSLKRIYPYLMSFQVKDKDLHKSPDILIDVTETDIPLLRARKLIFKAQNLWEIYRWRDRFIFYDKFIQRKHKFLRFLVLDQKVKRGKMYLNYVKGTSAFLTAYLKNPLSYPLGPLILLHKMEGRGIFLHASGIKARNKGYIFCGPSGSGKTTMTKIWQKSNRGVILNDDRIIIRKTNKGFYAYGCPWFTRSAKLLSNEKAKVNKIFFLDHNKNKKNSIKELTPSQALLRIFRHVVSPLWDKKMCNSLFNFLSDLITKSQCYDLSFSPTEEVIELIENA